MNDKPSRRTFRQRLDTLVNTLRDQIITGQFEPGSFLPSEEQLVEQFELSNKSVRKGLDVLEHRLVESIVVSLVVGGRLGVMMAYHDCGCVGRG